jgi:hypothetical protein
MDNRINSPASDRIIGAARIRCEAEASNLNPANEPRATQADAAFADKLERSVLDTIAPAIVGKGGELVPDASGHMGTMGCRDTVASPTYLTVQASRTRLQLAEDCRVLDLALDLSDTINAQNSIEKMIVGQMALLHRVSMKAGAMASDSVERAGMSIDSRYREQHTIQAQRSVNMAAKASAEFQNCALTLQRLRTGGKQNITVTHVQNTQVNEGGQAVVNGAGVASAGGGVVQK